MYNGKPLDNNRIRDLRCLKKDRLDGDISLHQRPLLLQETEKLSISFIFSPISI